MDTRNSNNSFHNLLPDENQKGQWNRQWQKTMIITNTKADWMLKLVVLSADIHDSEPQILIASQTSDQHEFVGHISFQLYSVYLVGLLHSALMSTKIPLWLFKEQVSVVARNIILLKLSKKLFQIRNLCILYTGTCPWNHPNVRNLN